MSLEQCSYIVGIIIFGAVLVVSICTIIKNNYISPKYKDHRLWLGLLYSIVSIMFIFLYIRLLAGISVSRGELRTYIFFSGFTLLISAIETAIRIDSKRRFG